MARDFKNPLYKQWRTQVYKRDTYHCQWPHCQMKCKLNAHHIKKWHNSPALRFHPNNGITLCSYHHKLIKNNEENYEQFFFKLVQNKLRQ